MDTIRCVHKEGFMFDSVRNLEILIRLRVCQCDAAAMPHGFPFRVVKRLCKGNR